MHRHHSHSTRTVRVLRLRACRRGDDGASLVEYALLLALIAVVAIGALVFLGGSVSNTLNTVANSVGSTTGGTSEGGGTNGGTQTNGAISFTSVTTPSPGSGTGPANGVYSVTLPEIGGTISFTATSTAQGAGPVAYSLGGALPTGLDANGHAAHTSISPSGLVTVPEYVTAGSYKFTVTATDHASPSPDTATLTVDLTVAHTKPPTLIVDGLGNLTTSPGGDQCAVTVNRQKNIILTGRCNSYSWLDGYLYYNTKAKDWDQIVPGDSPPSSGTIGDQFAYSSGVTQGTPPWHCNLGAASGNYCTDVIFSGGTVGGATAGSVGE